MQFVLGLFFGTFVGILIAGLCRCLSLNSMVEKNPRRLKKSLPEANGTIAGKLSSLEGRNRNVGTASAG